MSIWAGTGHRNLPRHEMCIVVLHRQLKEFLQRVKPSLVISGMAQGFDMSLAVVALQLHIPLHCYTTQDQTRFWYKSMATLNYYTPSLYNAILSKAAYRREYKHLTSNRKETYANRDAGLVMDSDYMVALYDTNNPASGTGMTVRMAINQGRPVTNIWGAYMKGLELGT